MSLTAFAVHPHAATTGGSRSEFEASSPLSRGFFFEPSVLKGEWGCRGLGALDLLEIECAMATSARWYQLRCRAPLTIMRAVAPIATQMLLARCGCLEKRCLAR